MPAHGRGGRWHTLPVSRPPARLLSGLQQGQALEINVLETGKPYQARISHINARVDAVAQTVELEARLDAPYPELVAGMSGVARILESHD